jgi:hypothetical protein
MVTNAHAQELYRYFNKKYFGNRLPKDMVVHFIRLKDQHGVTKLYRSRPGLAPADWRVAHSPDFIA